MSDSNYSAGERLRGSNFSENSRAQPKSVLKRETYGLNTSQGCYSEQEI